MKRLFFALCIASFSLLYPISGWAQSYWVPLNSGHEGEPPELSITTLSPCPDYSSSECVEVVLKLKGFWVEEVVEDGVTYHKLSVPKLTEWSNGLGSPTLPAYSSLIEIPRGWSSVYVYAGYSSKDDVPGNYMPFPEQHILYGLDENEAYEHVGFTQLDSSAYPLDTYPASEYSYEAETTPIRSINTTFLSLFPLQFNSERNSLTMNNIVLYLVQGTDNRRRSTAEFSASSYSFFDSLKQNVPNLDVEKIYANPDLRPFTDPTLLIISGYYSNAAGNKMLYTDYPGDPLRGIPSFADYLALKESQGYNTMVVPTDSIYNAGNTWMEKECLLLDKILEISRSRKISDVLLLGRVDQIPSWREKGDGIARTNIFNNYGAIFEGWVGPFANTNATIAVTFLLQNAGAPNLQILLDTTGDGQYDTTLFPGGVANNVGDEWYNESVVAMQNPQDLHKIRVEVIEDGVFWYLRLATSKAGADNGLPVNNNILTFYTDSNGQNEGARLFIRDRGGDIDGDGIRDDFDVFLPPGDVNALSNHWTDINALPTNGSDLEQALFNGFFDAGFEASDYAKMIWEPRGWHEYETSDYAYSVDFLPGYCQEYTTTGEPQYPNIMTSICTVNTSVCAMDFRDLADRWVCKADGKGFEYGETCNDGTANSFCYFGECWESRVKYLPVRAVGRWNLAKDGAKDLEVHLEKLIEYQQNVQHPPSSAYRHMLAMGRHNDDQSKGIFKGVLNTIVLNDKINSIITHHSDIGYAGADYPVFDQNILMPEAQKGLGLLAFVGHGSNGGFAWSYDTASPTELDMRTIPANKRVYPLVYAEACLTAQIDNLTFPVNILPTAWGDTVRSTTPADAWMNSRYGSIAYFGNATIGKTGAWVSGYPQFVNALFELDKPSVGSYWINVISKHITSPGGFYPWMTVRRILLGDPTTPLMGFDKADADNDGVLNASDTCPINYNPEQYACMVNEEIASCRNHVYIDYLLNESSLQDTLAVSALRECDPSHMSCIANVFQRFCRDIVGNVCEDDMKAQCIVPLSFKISTELAPIYSGSEYSEVKKGETALETRWPQRTYSEIDMNTKADSHYCICGNLQQSDSNQWLADCIDYCSTDNDPIINSNKTDRGWHQIQKWKKYDNSACSSSAERDLSLCGNPNNTEQTWSCDPQFQTAWRFGQRNDAKITRKWDWKNETLPKDWLGQADNGLVNAVSADTCHLDFPVGYGSVSGKIVLHYYPLGYPIAINPNDDHPVDPKSRHSYSLPMEIEYSRVLRDNQPSLFPDWMFEWQRQHIWNKFGTIDDIFNSTDPPIEDVFYAVEGTFAQPVQYGAETGIFIAEYNPLEPDHFIWSATHYGSSKFPEQLSNYGIVQASYKGKPAIFLVGGNRGEAVNGQTCILSQTNDGRYIWEIFEQRTSPVKIGGTLHYDPSKHRLLLFGGKSIDGDFDSDVYAMDLSASNPQWKRFEPAVPQDRPFFAHAKHAVSKSGELLYFYGGVKFDDLQGEIPMPVISYNLATHHWCELPVTPDAENSFCAAVNPSANQLVMAEINQLGGATISKYTPDMDQIVSIEYTPAEIPDMRGGCLAVHVMERDEILIIGQDISAQPTIGDLRIDPETLNKVDVPEPDQVCDAPEDGSREGLQCTYDDRWFQHRGVLECNPDTGHLACNATTRDSKWFGSYFAISRVNNVVISDNKAYLATNLGLQIVTLAVNYLPVFAGWAFTNGPANDIAFDGDRYAYVGDQEGIRIYDVKFSLIPILKDRVLMSMPVRSLILEGSMLYAATDHVVYAYDVSDPSHPVQQGIFDTGDPELSDVAICNDLVYLSGQRGFYAVDFSEINNPSSHMSLVTPAAIRHIQCDGRYLYSVDEMDHNAAYLLWNPLEPTYIGSHSVSGWVNGVAIDDRGRSGRGNGWWMELRKVE